MKRLFTHEYDDTAPRRLRIDYGGVNSEILRVEAGPTGHATLFVNKDASMVLARVFAQLAQCDYADGFHLHIREDFDAEKADALTLVVAQRDP